MNVDQELMLAHLRDQGFAIVAIPPESLGEHTAEDVESYLLEKSAMILETSYRTY